MHRRRKRQKICQEMAIEWVQNVTNHVAKLAMPDQNPKFLPPIEVQDEDSTRKYSEGKLHHLNR